MSTSRRKIIMAKASVECRLAPIDLPEGIARIQMKKFPPRNGTRRPKSTAAGSASAKRHLPFPACAASVRISEASFKLLAIDLCRLTADID